MTTSPPTPHGPSVGNEWTTRRLLDWMTGRLERSGIDGPRVVAEILLTEAVGGERIDLYADPDRPASQAERDRLKSMVRRALAHEPVQYITGRGDFLGRPFRVDRSTLIPRTATESLVQHGLQWLRRQALEAPTIADIGTGTGCIGITMALHMGAATIIATDLSADAITLARHNGSDHGVDDRMSFLTGDGVDPLIGLDGVDGFDLVISNPPYIPSDRLASLDPNIRDHEPSLALDGGSDGLDVVRRILQSISTVMKPGGLVLIEVDTVNAAAAGTFAESVDGLCQVSVCRDEFGDDRFIAAHSC